jgi:GAF domain-containing protein
MTQHVDVNTMEAAAAASATSYRSFAEATRAVLDLLSRHAPDAGVYLAHLDRGQDLQRVVDTRGGAAYGLRSNLTMPLGDSFDAHMADDRAPRLCNDVPAHPLYSRLPAQGRLGAAAYLGVPLELSDGARVGSLAALSRRTGRFAAEDEHLFGMLARVLASELERETNERDLKRLNEKLRASATGLEAVGKVASALVDPATDGRGALCAAACEVSGASAAFLLEPAGREFVSTAMHGVEMGPVTIQPRAGTPGRAFQATESYFVADATDHPALAPPLVEATGARSALFEPVLRDGQVAGVLILIWRGAHHRHQRLAGRAHPLWPPRAPSPSSTRACAPRPTALAPHRSAHRPRHPIACGTTSCRARSRARAAASSPCRSRCSTWTT